MHKLVRSFIIVAIVTGICCFTSQAAANTSYIEVVKDTPVYSFIGSEKIEVGSLVSGQKFVIVSSDANYYYIKFGNGNGYIKKTDVKTVSASKEQVLDIVNKTVNSTFITKRKTVIYDNMDKSRRSIGVINRNIRYPYLSKNKDWYRVQIGGEMGFVPSASVNEDPGIPVLMYHHMLVQPELTEFKGNNMVVRVSDFEQQMNYLKKSGYRTISINDLENYLLHDMNLTGTTVVITFDDGYLSTVTEAYPILKKNNFKATQFIIGCRTNAYAKPWDENTLQYVGFNEMKLTTDVYDYQHHTYCMHLREPISLIPFLISKTYDEVYQDTEKGKIHIGQVYDDPTHIQYLAYPWGQYDKETISAISKAGIKLAFTTETGNVKLGDNPYALKRQGVAPRHSLNDFINKLNGTYKDPLVNPIKSWDE
ncbi:polysaccharide deacetylase family protein [Bacillus cihuensis]|uniref:polysaccharide deacetylase family protein n=1 Tax=Bacillus cihuensis TaxID=1208599 RepID=UPI0003FA5FBC|nr:polysaccharide deacetylase family protein [Bacillus cihuensis]